MKATSSSKTRLKKKGSVTRVKQFQPAPVPAPMAPINTNVEYKRQQVRQNYLADNTLNQSENSQAMQQFYASNPNAANDFDYKRSLRMNKMSLKGTI